MNFKSLLSVALIVAMTVCLLACGVTADQTEPTTPVIWTPKATEATQPPETAAPETEATEASEPTETEAPATEAVESAAFTARIVSEDELNSLKDVTPFEDAKGEFRYHLMFSGEVTDFRYLSLESAFDDAGKLHVEQTKALLEQENLAKPVVVTIEFGDTVPTRAVAYNDADGAHLVLLSQSGEDGSLILTEAE